MGSQIRRAARVALVTTALAAWVVAALAAPAAAQTDNQAVLDKLIAAAKKEGTVTVYYTSDKETFQPGLDAFKAKYGLKVDGFFANSAPIATRFASEIATGKIFADVFYSSSPEIFTEYGSSFQPLTAENFPAFARIPDAAKFGEIAVARASFPFAFMYNTDKVKPADVPKTWTDLTDPKWKGESLMSDPRVSATYLFAYKVANEKVPGLFARIVANEPRLIEGAAPNAQQLSAGGGSIGYINYPSHATPLMDKGAPLNWGIIGGPSIARSAYLGATKGPHPHAGLLLTSFLMSDEVLKTYCKVAPGTQTLLDRTGARTGCTPVAEGAVFLPDTPLSKEDGDAVVKQLKLQ